MKMSSGSRLAATTLLLFVLAVLVVTFVPADAQDTAKEPAYRNFPFLVTEAQVADAAPDAADVATAVNDDAIARLDGYESDDTTLTIDVTEYDITRDADGFITSITAA